MSVIRLGVLLLLVLPFRAYGRVNYTLAAHALPGINMPGRVRNASFARSLPVFTMGGDLNLSMNAGPYQIGVCLGAMGLGTKITAKNDTRGNMRTVSRANGSHYFSTAVYAQWNLFAFKRAELGVFLGGMATYIVEKQTPLGPNGNQAFNLTLNSVTTHEGMHVSPMLGVAGMRNFKRFFIDARLTYCAGLREISRTTYSVREGGNIYQGASSNYGSRAFLSLGIGIRL